MVSMATMGSPSNGLLWSGGGIDCLSDTASESNDPMHPSTLSTMAAILLCEEEAEVTL